MFKKGVSSRGQQQISGADRRKLRRCISELFSQATEADLECILPSKGDVLVTKLSARVLVYSVFSPEAGCACPMLFDSDGRGHDIFPTVYALWKVPHLLPVLELKGGEVSRYVLGGADLMLPGILLPPHGLPPFAEGQMVAVAVPGNKAPIAVGKTVISREKAESTGMRGKAVAIAHYYRDGLWASVEQPFAPNSGFGEEVVMPADSMGEGEEGGGGGEGGKGGEGEAAGEEEEVVGGGEDGREVKEESVRMSPAEMDTLLHACLLQALRTSVRDADLPLPGSTLWSAHVLPSRPPGCKLDIKKSSHKKVSKWLHSLSATRLVSVKEDKHSKEAVITAVDRTHPDYRAFKPHTKSEVDPPPPSAPEELASGEQAAIEVVEVYKPTHNVTALFEGAGADVSAYYSLAEATQVASTYIEEHGLEKAGDRAWVVLDAVLCDALYKGAVKKGTLYPTQIHKKEVGPTLSRRMQAHHQVTRGGKVVVRKGALQPVQIVSERRQGNKKVTRVSGVESFLVDPTALASELQKKFACSTALSEVAGKKGQLEVLVQGDVLENLGWHLADHYSIPKKYIEVLDKTRKG